MRGQIETLTLKQLDFAAGLVSDLDLRGLITKKLAKFANMAFPKPEIIMKNPTSSASHGPDSPSTLSSRLASIDAYRGLVMFLMMAEVLHLSKMKEAFSKSTFWSTLAYHQTHVEWRGCSLHDMIQPSFSFLVGAALPFSLAARKSRGEPVWASILHAAWRALLLTFLGVFLRSMHSPSTRFTFEDTLSQIGLGYLPLFLIALGKPRWRWIALVVILAGYWAAFWAHPLPGPDFDYATAGVSSDWKHNATGLAAHWDKNTNAAWAFDRWFLNLFPQPGGKPFQFNSGGYSTLSFIPTLGTMLLGLIAGGWLRGDSAWWKKILWLTITGAVALAAGLALDHFGICPNVKRIWTPSWVLFSGGICLLALAAFYLVLDVVGFKFWAYPLEVIGANSIVAYCMAHVLDDFVVDSFHIHLGKNVFKALGEAYEPVVQGGVVLIVYWLILFWMYRKRIFLRI
jgi:heparan-alpha-glucosaminide N-acetyltransferase